MITIKLKWIEYDNFFDLWREHQKDTQMLYVIGEAERCYIGCIGIKGGQQGLRQRYQWQYLQRSLAIFKTEESEGQVSYAACFKQTNKVSKKAIEAAESLVQNAFINKCGQASALFEPVKVRDGFVLENKGDVPSFLAS